MEKDLPPIGKNLPRFSLEERDRRWGRLRQKMAASQIDCLLIWSSNATYNMSSANMRYVTHTDSTGVCLFPRVGEPVIFSGYLHVYIYQTVMQDWMKDIRPAPSPENVIREIKERGLERGTIGVVGFGGSLARWYPEIVPYGAHVRLLKGLPEANFINASWVLDELRMIKSTEEIGRLDEAAALAYAMFEAVVKTARPGVRECEVWGAMLQACVGNGGEDTMIMLDSGNPPLLHGRMSPATRRPLEKGDMIITEYHSNYGGYTIAVEHTFSLGRPAKQYREMHRVSEDAYRNGMGKMRPGAAYGDVIEAFRAPVRKAGMAYIEIGICGHGLSSPEFPSTVFGGEGGIWHEHGLAQIPDVKLQENMVFGTNMDVHNPAWNDNTGVMLGDTIHVTAAGPRQMTRIPVELTVI